MLDLTLRGYHAPSYTTFRTIPSSELRLIIIIGGGGRGFGEFTFTFTFWVQVGLRETGCWWRAWAGVYAHGGVGIFGRGFLVMMVVVVVGLSVEWVWGFGGEEGVGVGGEREGEGRGEEGVWDHWRGSGHGFFGCLLVC